MKYLSAVAIVLLAFTFPASGQEMLPPKSIRQIAIMPIPTEEKIPDLSRFIKRQEIANWMYALGIIMMGAYAISDARFEDKEGLLYASGVFWTVGWVVDRSSYSVIE